MNGSEYPVEGSRRIGAIFQAGRALSGAFRSRTAEENSAQIAPVAVSALLVFVGYFLGAKIGFALTFQPHPVAVLWPPNAVLLAALLLTPFRIWGILLLAAFGAHWVVQLQSDVPPWMILCWFISNSCEALIGATTIRHFVGPHVRLDRLRTVAMFCLCGAFLGPFLSSFLDSAFVVLNHWGQGSYWEIWRIRFTSNVLAAVTVAAPIVTWIRREVPFWRQLSRRRVLEGSCLLLGLFAISFGLFNGMASDADSALLYVPLPFLLWGAVRFGSRGATAAISAVAFVAIVGVARGHGPFAGKSPEESALSVQLFLIFMSVPLLFLAAIMEERAEVAEKLHEREERVELAAESAHLALWTIDFLHHKSWMNEKGRELFGFAPEERLSRELFLSRVHPEDRRAADAVIQSARLASRKFEVEYRLLRPDGETRWLISRGRYLRNDLGQLSELIGVAIDVTAQVKAALELRLQREELARLGRVALMGELTASVAHELNQPLTAIASNAAAGKRFLAKGAADPKMLEELLGDVFADAQRAGNIIQGIRHLVRKGEGNRTSVELNQVILDVLRLLHSDLLGRSATVETNLFPGVSAIQADPVHLQQLLLNLIMNALEAMQHTPVANRRILISTWAANGSVEVSVRDHGAGLPQEDPEKVFARFFSTKPDGMGMGLTIVRSIVDAYGGEVGAESLEDGARFFFRLPVV
jgi:PAS domain S-box-containing protein